MEQQVQEPQLEPTPSVDPSPASDAPAPESVPQPTDEEVSPLAAAEAGEPKPYAPNFKYKVLDEEREISHPLFKQLVKDAETEKQVREIFEKADGLDIYKTKYSNLDSEYKNTVAELQNIQEAIDQARQYWQADKEKFFESLGIDVKDVYKWVAEKVKYMELPQEQKELYDRERESRLRAAELERTNARYEQMRQQQMLQARSFELDQGIESPQVAPVAKAYDAIYGPGAFRQEVIRQGVLEFQLRGQDVPVSEALAAVYTKAKVLADRAAQTGAPKESPKVIPTVRSGTASPAKKKITSLADLEKLAREIQD